MVKLTNITKKFDKAVAVSFSSLEIKNGEFLGILGSSGCGKTTLLRLIAGLEAPDSGRIEINGKVVNNPQILIPPRERNVGMIFQDLALWPHMTVGEHIKFVLQNRMPSQKFQSASWRTKFKIQNNETEDKINELLDLVKLPNHYFSSYPHQLSGGERQRLAIARSLAQNPKILLLDEPLANLDAILKRDLQSEIKKLQTNLGITLIYVTHDVRELEEEAQRLVIMNKGRIVQEGEAKEIFASPKNEFVSRLLGEK